MPSFFDSITPAGAYDGVSKIYTLPAAPSPPDVLLLLFDGILLNPNIDYTLIDNVITFSAIIPVKKTILRAYFQIDSPAPVDETIEFVNNETPYYIGVNQYTLQQIPVPMESLRLTMDGVSLFQGIDYDIVGKVITFRYTVPSNAILTANYRLLLEFRIKQYAKSGIISYIRGYLNDPAAVIWSDAELLQWISQAEMEITQRLSIYWIKFPLALYAGQGLYDMPENLKGITRLTYRSTPVEMITQYQMATLVPTYRNQQSRVLYASLQFEGYYTLRLFCTPYEDLPALSQGNDIYTDKNLLNEFQISAYFYSSETTPYIITPDYLARRTIRYYVMWKAFSIEGNGQDINVAGYYRQKFEEQMAKNTVFYDKIYASKERQLQPQFLNVKRRVARPVLPPNYGPIVPPR